MCLDIGVTPESSCHNLCFHVNLCSQREVSYMNLQPTRLHRLTVDNYLRIVLWLYYNLVRIASTPNYQTGGPIKKLFTTRKLCKKVSTCLHKGHRLSVLTFWCSDETIPTNQRVCLLVCSPLKIVKYDLLPRVFGIWRQNQRFTNVG